MVRAIKAKRDHWVLATKVGNVYRGGNAKGTGGLTRRWVQRAMDLSLQRLGLDHVDIYYMHRTDADVGFDEVVFRVPPAPADDQKGGWCRPPAPQGLTTESGGGSR